MVVISSKKKRNNYSMIPKFFTGRYTSLKVNMLKSDTQQHCYRMFCWNKYRHRSIFFIILAVLFILHGLLFRQLVPSIGASVIRDASLPKTTIVLMGYSTERLENYQLILPAYGTMDQALDRIIFLWNSKSCHLKIIIIIIIIIFF